MAERSYPTLEVRGGDREELPHVRGAAAVQHRRAERSYSTFKVRRGGHEEISLIHGKEQWLCFAGTAMKRYTRS